MGDRLWVIGYGSWISLDLRLEQYDKCIRIYKQRRDVLTRRGRVHNPYSLTFAFTSRRLFTPVCTSYPVRRKIHTWQLGTGLVFRSAKARLGMAGPRKLRCGAAACGSDLRKRSPAKSSHVCDARLPGRSNLEQRLSSSRNLQPKSLSLKLANVACEPAPVN